MLLNRAIDAESMLCVPRAGGTGAVGPGHVFNEKQWKAMKKQWKAMKSNEKQWKAMKKQWKAMKKQWKAMKSNEK